MLLPIEVMMLLKAAQDVIDEETVRVFIQVETPTGTLAAVGRLSDDREAVRVVAETLAEHRHDAHIRIYDVPE